MTIVEQLAAYAAKFREGELHDEEFRKIAAMLIAAMRSSNEIEWLARRLSIGNET